MSENKQTAKLEKWTIEKRSFSNEEYEILRGYVSGHPKLPDGMYVTTSPIEKRVGERTIETKNTLYNLGEPGPAVGIQPTAMHGEEK